MRAENVLAGEQLSQKRSGMVLESDTCVEVESRRKHPSVRRRFEEIRRKSSGPREYQVQHLSSGLILQGLKRGKLTLENRGKIWMKVRSFSFILLSCGIGMGISTIFISDKGNYSKTTHGWESKRASSASNLKTMYFFKKLMLASFKLCYSNEQK